MPDIRTMAETVGTSLYAARMGAWLLSAFGGLALLLAVVGIYGVLSFTIARRTREMGIRLALGAGNRRVFLLVVRDGMWLVGLGAAIGSSRRSFGAQSLAALPLRHLAARTCRRSPARWRCSPPSRSSPARSRPGAPSASTR